MASIPFHARSLVSLLGAFRSEMAASTSSSGLASSPHASLVHLRHRVTSTPDRRNPHESLIRELRKSTVSQKDAESRFGTLSSLGAYSTDMVLDPYDQKSKWPGLVAWFRGTEYMTGGKVRNLLESLVQDYMAYARIRGMGETKVKVATEVMDCYQAVHKALATAQLAPLRDRVSPNTLRELELQVASMRRQGVVKSTWVVHDALDTPRACASAIKFVKRRVVMTDSSGGLSTLADEDKTTFAQQTVRIKTTQSLRLEDGNGRVLRRKTKMPVTDYWVFEKVLAKGVENSRWRLLKRLQGL